MLSRLRWIERQSRRTWMSTAGIERDHCALLFPGQGSQYVGMGKDLYNAFPNSAKQVFDEADDALGGKLKSLMFDGQQEVLTYTENAQPAILTTSIAILRVMEREFGFNVADACQYVLGHSLGEYSALVAAKSLSLTDAVKLVRLRGEAMTKAVQDVQTAMSALVVRANSLAMLEEAMSDIQADLPQGEQVELANINSSFQVVISGTAKGVDMASNILQQRRFAARAVDLPVSAPFHCTLMQPAADVMEEALANIKFDPPVVDVISNVTAQPYRDVAEIPKMLVKQVTKTVQWQRSIKYCKEQDISDFVCFGPGRVLANLIKKEYPLSNISPLATAADIDGHAQETRVRIAASSKPQKA